MNRHPFTHRIFLAVALLMFCIVASHVDAAENLKKRIVGLWHVHGSFADWRIAADGTFKEEGVFTTSGKYELLENDRIRIVPGIGVPGIYDTRFDGDDLLLLVKDVPLLRLKPIK